MDDRDGFVQYERFEIGQIAELFGGTEKFADLSKRETTQTEISLLPLFSGWRWYRIMD